MAVIEADKELFEKEIKEGKVLVDFNADWCGPCQMLKPVIEQLSEEKKDLKIVSVNIDNEEDLTREYGVMSIPCLIVFEDGKEIKRKVGFQNKEAIESLLEDK